MWGPGFVAGCRHRGFHQLRLRTFLLPCVPASWPPFTIAVLAHRKVTTLEQAKTRPDGSRMMSVASQALRPWTERCTSFTWMR